MALPSMLELGGVSPENLFDQLKKNGLSEVDAGILVGSWIYHNFGGGQRTFAYGVDLDASAPKCAPTFARTFQHVDWTDGISIVQAQTSAGEDGFNLRFHRIENDLDALSRDIAKVFSCVAELRSSLHDRLAEIKNELNRIDSDLYQCCGDRVGPPRPLPPYFGSLAESGRFLGATKIGVNPVTMWQSDRGIVMLPAVLPVAGNPVVDPRVESSGAFARFAVDHPEVARAFEHKPVAVSDLVTHFGARVLSNGVTVADAVAGLPSAATFPSIQAVTEALSEQAAGMLRANAGVPDVFAAALEVGTGASLGTAGIGQLKQVPESALEALQKSGFTTISSVASADPEKLGAALKRANVKATAGDVAAMITTAKTITMIR